MGVTGGLTESCLPHRDSLPQECPPGDYVKDVSRQRNMSTSVLCLLHVYVMEHASNHSLWIWEGILKSDVKAHLNNCDYESWALAMCQACYHTLDVHYHV